MVNTTESDYGMYMLQVGNGIGKPHTEVYFLKRLSSLPTKPITSVSHIGLISAGLSVVFILVIIFVVACVHRHLRRRETIEKNVGYLFVVPSTPYYNDTTAQPPLVPWDRLDVQGEAIALSSSLPAENVDVHSEIYSEIDPQLVEDIISRDDGATNEAQLGDCLSLLVCCQLCAASSFDDDDDDDDDVDDDDDDDDDDDSASVAYDYYTSVTSGDDDDNANDSSDEFIP
ncbi:hypothetical protein DPMN_029389 [Dreissena polymorpha]|uniref:Uncharacterized protein n=1 Tax=Dreissena polymorpha TaxID=45954 RepID=A0A9D4RH34_DREPO|nr:hypothetical protein DPMN_029389 [Dreissena polymorpha]